MKSYTQGRNYAGSLTKNTASAHLTLMDEFANDDYRLLCAMHDWPWLERERTLTTVASQQAYILPYDCDKVRSVTVTIGTQVYHPNPSPSQEFWDQLNESQYTADIPEWFRVFNGQLELWPTPATAGNTITVTQKTRVIDLGIADYTTGTIVTATNGGTAIVGSGTSWNASMVGRWIKITLTDATNVGDGLWYEISSVTNATNLTLVRAYGGNSIVAGSASYTIGQMPLLPEQFHLMPWLSAAGLYWQKENDSRGAAYLEQHGKIGSGSSPSTGQVKLLEATGKESVMDYVIDDGEPHQLINPNLTISL